jgi:hypothetical protein
MVIENKHSSEIGARLILNVSAHPYARRRMRRRFNVDRLLVLNNPPASSLATCSAGNPSDSAPLLRVSYMMPAASQDATENVVLTCCGI